MNSRATYRFRMESMRKSRKNLSFCVRIELAIKGMVREGGGIPQDDQLHAGTSHGYIHATQVVEKAYLPLCVGTYQADENHVPLLSLEAIHRMDGDEGAEGLEEGVSFDERT